MLSSAQKTLLGLYRPEAGSLKIGGVDVADISDDERRFCIGCVEQHFSRVPGTVLEALRRASTGRTVLSISHRVYESLGGRTVEIGARR